MIAAMCVFFCVTLTFLFYMECTALPGIIAQFYSRCTDISPLYCIFFYLFVTFIVINGGVLKCMKCGEQRVYMKYFVLFLV